MLGKGRKLSKKIVLIGDAKVGKTTYMDALLGRKREVVPTVGAEASTLEIENGKYKYRLEILDCGGEYGGLKEKYWTNADGGLLMFSLDNPESYARCLEIRKNLSFPTVMCANKCDLERKVFEGFLEYREICATKNYNLKAPLQELLSKIEFLAISNRGKR